jgi:predicted ABC-type ATPase
MTQPKIIIIAGPNGAGKTTFAREFMTTPKHVSEPVPSYGQVPADANADFRGSLAAIKRAAVRARQLAEQTGTDLIVVRGGKVVRVPPKEKPSS